MPHLSRSTKGKVFLCHDIVDEQMERHQTLDLRLVLGRNNDKPNNKGKDGVWGKLT